MVGHLMTDKELDLLIEVLENESRSIAIETRRTDANTMRHDLRERERVIDRLIERFKEIKAGDLLGMTTT